MLEGSPGRVPTGFGELSTGALPTAPPQWRKFCLGPEGHWEEVGPEMGRKLLPRTWPATLQDGAGLALAGSPAGLSRIFVQKGQGQGWCLNLGESRYPPAEAIPLDLDQEWWASSPHDAPS